MDSEQKSGYPHPLPPPSYDYGMSSNAGGYPPQGPQSMPMQMPMIPPQHHQHYHVPPVIMEQPATFVVAPQVGPDPTMVTCPSCRSTVVTRMDYEASTRTHICAGLLCLFGCWLCVCIPYCMDSCRNGNHYCPSCGSYIGTYRS